MMRYCIYIFLQCTWGLLQTVAGFLLFLSNRKRKHIFYHGSILTMWDRPAGLSMGLFIFVPDDDGETAGQMTVHEYGHTIQSLVLGPLYLPVVGILSYMWCNLTYFRRMRKEKNLPYTYFFIEKWASSTGERLLKEKAII